MRRFISAEKTYQVTDAEYTQLLARFNLANLENGYIEVACICPASYSCCLDCSLGNGEKESQNCFTILRQQNVTFACLVLTHDFIGVFGKEGEQEIQKMADWLSTWEYVPGEKE